MVPFNNSYMTSLNKCVFITYSSLIPCCNDIHNNVTSGTALCLRPNKKIDVFPVTGQKNFG